MDKPANSSWVRLQETVVRRDGIMVTAYRQSDGSIVFQKVNPRDGIPVVGGPSNEDIEKFGEGNLEEGIRRVLEVYKGVDSRYFRAGEEVPFERCLEILGYSI